MRTISSVSTGRTRRFTTRACTTRLLPKLRNILILLYQVDYIIVGSISAFQRFSISARYALRASLVSTAPLAPCQHAPAGASAFSLSAGWRGSSLRSARQSFCPAVSQNVTGHEPNGRKLPGEAQGGVLK